MQIRLSLDPVKQAVTDLEVACLGRVDTVVLPRHFDRTDGVPFGGSSGVIVLTIESQVGRDKENARTIGILCQQSLDHAMDIAFVLPASLARTVVVPK